MLVWFIKYVVTVTIKKEFTYRQLDDIFKGGNTVPHENVYIQKINLQKLFTYRQLDDIFKGGNTVPHENVYIRKINLQKTLEIGNFTKRTSELHERAINSKKSICSLEEYRKGFNFCWRSKVIVEPKSAQQKIDFWADTTHNSGILSRFSDKRPNRSHLRGAPKTKVACSPALPKSVPGLRWISEDCLLCKWS